MLSDKNDKLDEWRKAMNERDTAREDLKEMTVNRQLLVKEKEAFATQMKDKVNNLDKELKDRHSELESLKLEFAKLEK